LTHAEPQTLYPDVEQVAVQTPPEHAGTPPSTAVVQTLPHEPQLLRSVFGLTHVPEQATSPAVTQVTTHDPLLHAAVAPVVDVEHWAPHLPQLAELVCRFGHEVPHWVVPVGHALTHAYGETPASLWAQRLPPSQVAWHAPQLAAVESSVAQTTPASPPASPAEPASPPAATQSPNPAAQV
jgi:hypothetical protein